MFLRNYGLKRNYLPIWALMLTRIQPSDSLQKLRDEKQCTVWTVKDAWLPDAGEFPAYLRFRLLFGASRRIISITWARDTGDSLGMS